MNRRAPTKGRPPGGLTDKRRAILSGALTVFARDGYTRASIDAISSRAAVSTRTIYNHFADKADLFQAVIQESAARAADAQIAIIDRHLRKVTDLESDLVEFGIALVAAMSSEQAEHFALVRQVQAELQHIPPAAIEAWQNAGPRRVLRVLGDRLQQLSDAGLLRVEDAELAAKHLMLLLSAADSPYRPAGGDSAEVAATVTAGVRTFLYGYAAERPEPAPDGR